MTIDKYAMCPGGTGKKIKFCCSDLPQELDKLERLKEAEQFQSCLETVERLEKKYPGRACLTRIKIDTLRALDRRDEAQQLVTQVLQHDADNPTVLAEAAMLTLESAESQADIIKAIDQLQSAIEHASEWSEVLVQAVLNIGVLAMRYELWLSAQAHMLVYEGVAQDESALSFLAEMGRAGEMPVAFRDARRFFGTVDDVPWKDEFEEATVLAGRAQWRAAAQKLQALAAREDHPYIWANLGLLRGWLGDIDGTVEAWQRYVAHDIDYDDAVAVHAMICTLADKAIVPRVNMVQVVYPITNWDQAVERFISHPQIAASKRRVEAIPDQETAPPSQNFEIVDRAGGAPEDTSRFEDYPQWCSDVWMYGRETNREARLYLSCAADCESMARQVIEEAGGDALGPATETTSTESLILAKEFRWYTPSFVVLSGADQEAAVRSFWRHRLNEHWVSTPNAWLDDATPLQAAEVPDQRARLDALVLTLENGYLGPIDLEPWPNLLTRELRQKLNLPTDIPYSEEFWNSPAKVHRLRWIQPESVPDEHLFELIRYAQSLGAHRCMLNLGQEILNRNLLEPEAVYQVYAVMGLAAGVSGLAVEYLQKARESLVETNQSPAPVLSMELLSLFRVGRVQQALDLMQNMLQRYPRDVGVMEALQQFHEMLQSSFVPSQPSDAGQQGGTPSGGKLWTPDSDAPQASPSKIWTPG